MIAHDDALIRVALGIGHVDGQRSAARFCGSNAISAFMSSVSWVSFSSVVMACLLVVGDSLLAVVGERAVQHDAWGVEGVHKDAPMCGIGDEQR